MGYGGSLSPAGCSGFFLFPIGRGITLPLFHAYSGQLLLGGDGGGEESDAEGGISGSQRVLKVCRCSHGSMEG